MPTLIVRKMAQVPQPSRISRAVRERQELYEGFIKQIGGDIGELELFPDEQIRSEKVRLTRAATRLVTPIESWDANGRVYFRIRPVARRRGRPSNQSRQQEQQRRTA